MLMLYGSNFISWCVCDISDFSMFTNKYLRTSMAHIYQLTKMNKLLQQDQCGHISQNWYCSKVVTLQRVDIVWFHLNKVQQIGKTNLWWSSEQCLSLVWMGSWLRLFTMGFLGPGNGLFPRGGHMGGLTWWKFIKT